MAGATTAVIGREAELGAIRAFLAGTGMRALVVEGEAGIGKTTLWSAGVAEAAERGYCVLACRPAASEVQLAFAALGDLLDGVLDQALGELPTPQRRALEVALLLEERPGPAPDQRAIGLAVLGVLRALAEAQPVLVAVDDAQWLDSETGAVLQFALRRLDDEPVALLAAVRVEADRQASNRLEAAIPADRQTRVHVGPLSVAGLHRLVRARLDLGLPRPLLVRLHEASGGNPFYALELAAALEARGELRPGERLPLPESLQELVQARLARLPETTREVLLAAVLLTNPTPASLQAATSARRAHAALETARKAGVVEPNDERVVFTHPLLAAAMYSAASSDDVRRMHRRLAAIVGDPEAKARHMALGAGRRDAQVAAALDRAAERAMARGAPLAAAELLELAVQATPLRQRTDLRRRRLEAAEAHFSSGAMGEAMSILRSALDELPSGDERAEVLVRLARASSKLQEMLELGEQALDEATCDGTRAEAHLILAWSWALRDMEFGLRHARLALELAEQLGDRRMLMRAITLCAMYELSVGRITPGLLERAIALRAEGDRVDRHPAPQLALATRQRLQGRLDEARALLEELARETAERGDEPAWLISHWGLVEVELQAGNWERAAEHAASMYELAEQMGLEHDGSWSLYRKALVDAHLGHVDEARAATEFGISLIRDTGSGNAYVSHLGVLGFLELSLGNQAAAEGHFQAMLRWTAEKRLALLPNPMAPYAIEAVVAGGDLVEAGELTSRYERDGHALDSPWGLAIAARLRGILAAAAGDLASGLAELGRALRLQEDRHWPFERARTLLSLGRVQRRAKQKAAARHSLEQALAVFEQLPAPLWADRAKAELQRLGLPRADRDELTETERRVAELAASGLKNREVAAQLFLSPKTVEANLARAYRKLGIHSRAELGARLAGVGREPAQA